MTAHRIFLPTVHAEDLLQLPEGIYIHQALVSDGEMILDVTSDKDLGAAHINALYGNIEEDEKRIHFGMFEAR